MTDLGSENERTVEDVIIRLPRLACGRRDQVSTSIRDQDEDVVNTPVPQSPADVPTIPTPTAFQSDATEKSRSREVDNANELEIYVLGAAGPLGTSDQQRAMADAVLPELELTIRILSYHLTGSELHIWEVSDMPTGSYRPPRVSAGHRIDITPPCGVPLGSLDPLVGCQHVQARTLMASEPRARQRSAADLPARHRCRHSARGRRCRSHRSDTANSPCRPATQDHGAGSQRPVPAPLRPSHGPRNTADPASLRHRDPPSSQSGSDRTDPPDHLPQTMGSESQTHRESGY
ncbi:hypothetical protein EDD28_2611 [Salana multivorans]|uniref:Uncharacterized protein n=1 Tax=Salana multivorans TaxID=120377 RepID=A0A3N2D0D6_9MICO|nr:hypothetical protein EDD28_2611 [Salana multivorans]